ncbi:hypothetical protein N2152v2_002519 [Parachlorella kessleri]
MAPKPRKQALPKLEKPKYVPQNGSLAFATVLAFYKVGACPSAEGDCARAKLKEALAELKAAWNGLKDPPLECKDDPDEMMDLPMYSGKGPSKISRLQNVEYGLKHRKQGPIMAPDSREPHLKLTEEGEKTARYLLERHERKYKAPMPGFEGFQHPGKAAGGEGEAELQDEGHEGAAGGEAGSSKEQAKAKEGGGSETDEAAVMTPVKKAGNKRRRKQVPGEGDDDDGEAEPKPKAKRRGKAAQQA